MTKTTTDNGQNEMIAAIDLGSNSFHMIVARMDGQGGFAMLDKIKEMVRLRGGLDEQGHLSTEKQQEALACLHRFGERIKHFPVDNVRIAGTNTLRSMKDSEDFIAQANAALGHEISIISGHEEARMVYLGVSHTLSNDHGKQLVIDIGGGSTEFIIGKKFEPKALESLNIGSVSATQRFFGNGNLSAKNWKKANTALRLEIMPIEKTFCSGNWNRAIGSSGTIKATRKIIQELQLEKFGISLYALHQIRDRMIAAKTIDKLALPGLIPERIPVYAGGLAVLIAAFESLRLEIMTVSDGALREGLLYDLMGRIQHEDVRSRAVDDLQQRFSVDINQAQRVRQTALHFFKQARKAWELPKNTQLLLGWAADLHEVGMSITHNKYHQHGAYILDYVDMSGFSRKEQHWLSVMVQTHRRKLSYDTFDGLPNAEQRTVKRLSILLRLAVLLHRLRLDQEVVPKLSATSTSLTLSCDKVLLEQRNLLLADLQREKLWLEKVSIELGY
ncbi:MAG: Ppx/GppA family phosphatase [Cocleimonas sp.]|nr:Ppx/GppA family phosphatase [Cocleimonas sp.]